MRAVITRVLSASVTIDGKCVSKINKGFLVLLGVHTSDTEEQAKKIADKICGQDGPDSPRLQDRRSQNLCMSWLYQSAKQEVSMSEQECLVQT